MLKCSWNLCVKTPTKHLPSVWGIFIRMEITLKADLMVGTHWTGLLVRQILPRKTKMSSENQWLEVGRCISYWNRPFLGDILVFRGCTSSLPEWHVAPLVRRVSKRRNAQRTVNLRARSEMARDFRWFWGMFLDLQPWDVSNISKPLTTKEFPEIISKLKTSRNESYHVISSEPANSVKWRFQRIPWQNIQSSLWLVLLGGTMLQIIVLLGESSTRKNNMLDSIWSLPKAWFLPLRV